MKGKFYIPIALSILISILAFIEAFEESIRYRTMFYVDTVNYYAGYIFLFVYIMPLIIILFNIKSLKEQKAYPITIFYSIVGLVLSIFISVKKADELLDFIVKYHPYIYILPMLVIAVNLKKLNKKFFLLTLFIILIYTAFLIKYLKLPHIYINFSSSYTRLIITYLILMLLQLITYNKSKWKEPK
ncbi:MAG TPA: hypothetical protein ENO33_04915 [Hydrogenobaculum sp.]|nr:hypothetical protein [Hydrogenobaculum sp.]